MINRALPPPRSPTVEDETITAVIAVKLGASAAISKLIAGSVEKRALARTSTAETNAPWSRNELERGITMKNVETIGPLTKPYDMTDEQEGSVDPLLTIAADRLRHVTGGGDGEKCVMLHGPNHNPILLRPGDGVVATPLGPVEQKMTPGANTMVRTQSGPLNVGETFGQVADVLCPNGFVAAPNS